MTVRSLDEVEFAAQLPSFEPDTSLANVRTFATAAGWMSPRFMDHEKAREEGLPGAMVPGIMSQGFLVAMIHRWAPDARIISVDTVFRAPVLADVSHRITGLVTDLNEEEARVEIDLTVTDNAGVTRVFGTASVGF